MGGFGDTELDSLPLTSSIGDGNRFRFTRIPRPQARRAGNLKSQRSTKGQTLNPSSELATRNSPLAPRFRLSELATRNSPPVTRNCDQSGHGCPSYGVGVGAPSFGVRERSSRFSLSGVPKSGSSRCRSPKKLRFRIVGRKMRDSHLLESRWRGRSRHLTGRSSDAVHYNEPRTAGNVTEIRCL